MVFFVPGKFVAIREALDASRFSDAEGPVFVGMKKQMRVAKTCVHCARDVIPTESAALSVVGMFEIQTFSLFSQVAFG